MAWPWPSWCTVAGTCPFTPCPHLCHCRGYRAESRHLWRPQPACSDAPLSVFPPRREAHSGSDGDRTPLTVSVNELGQGVPLKTPPRAGGKDKAHGLCQRPMGTSRTSPPRASLSRSRPLSVPRAPPGGSGDSAARARCGSPVDAAPRGGRSPPSARPGVSFGVGTHGPAGPAQRPAPCRATLGMCGDFVLLAQNVATYNVWVLAARCGERGRKGRVSKPAAPEQGSLPDAAVRSLFSHLPDQGPVTWPHLAAKESGQCRLYFGWLCNLLKSRGYTS